MWQDLGFSIYELLTVAIFFTGIIVAVIKKKWIYFIVALSACMIIVSLVPNSGYTIIQGVSVGLFILVIGLVIYKIQQDKIKRYQESTYYKQTQSEYDEVMRNNIGKYGEFLIFDELKQLEDEGARFLFNTYIPKEDGSTAEIDVIILTKAGIFVIESKNYSGWIFGDKDRKNWTVTLQSGEKNQFYNPIWQNNSHCKYLKKYLYLDASEIMSYIVFSDRCEFKKVPENTSSYRILHRRHLLYHIEEDIERRGAILSEEEIDDYFDCLYPLTQVSDEEKQKHIDDLSIW